MSDPLSEVPTLPGIINKENWSPSVFGKKLGWTLAAWKAAVPLGVAVSPAATAFIDKISSMTAQFGITIHIDKPVFEQMLPIVLFGLILVGHDYAKLKTDSKFL